MKYCIVLTLVFVTSFLTGQDIAVQATFEVDYIDLGVIERGDVRDTVFTFTNTGTEDLVIEIASGCECTELDWTRGAIKPGEQGKIDVHFDSSKKEYSEVIEVDVNFENTNPITEGPYFRILEYTYTFKED